MRILICSIHPEVGYSGGRYHAWMMGEALSCGGHQVFLWTNAEPVYAKDFVNWGGHDSLNLCIDRHFFNPPREKFDWVIVVPDMSSSRSVYARWLRCAARSRARVALLNFESANFFNTFSPVPRDPKKWKSWREVSRFCDVILSSAEISNRYAEEFYTEAPDGCVFATCQPSINSVEADAAVAVPEKNRIFVITRFSSSDSGHKGGEELLLTLNDEIRGCTLCLLVGKNGVPRHVRTILDERSEQCGFEYELLQELDDRAKFSYLKSAKLMLFLSRFEGFGYPPVEATYCGVPCIASDLEILRETSGDALMYVDPTNPSEIGVAIQRIFDGGWRASPEDAARVARLVSASAYSDRLSNILSSKPIAEAPLLQFSVPIANVKILFWTIGEGIMWVVGKVRSAIRHCKRAVLILINPKRQFE